MSKASFEVLLEKVRPFLHKKNDVYAVLSSGSPICKKTKLAAILRYLAGGSYLDICALFGLSSVHFFSKDYILWETKDAINKACEIIFDKISLKNMHKGFQNFPGGIWTSV